jgi:hypothetical protein
MLPRTHLIRHGETHTGRIFRFRRGVVINVDTVGAGITMIVVAIAALIHCGAAGREYE